MALVAAATKDTLPLLSVLIVALTERLDGGVLLVAGVSPLPQEENRTTREIKIKDDSFFICIILMIVLCEQELY